jgi:hypothetical protein
MPDVTFIVGAGIALAVVVTYLLSRWRRSLRERRARAWPEVAERLGGRFHQGTEGQMRIVAELDGRPLIVDSGGEQTSIVVGADAARGFTVQVVRPFHSSLLAEMLELSEVRIDGDPAFDELYLVKANDEHLARAWLDAPTRKAMVVAEAYQFGLDGINASGQRASVEASAGALESAMRATALLAAGGRRLHARWRDLAAALGATFLRSDSLLDGHLWLVRGEVSIVVEVTDTREEPSSKEDVSYQRHARRLVTRLRREGSRASVVTCVRGQLVADAAVAFVVTEAEDLDDVPKRWRRAHPDWIPWPYAARLRGPGPEAEAILSTVVRPALFELEPLVLERSRREVTILWAGVQLDPVKLRRACEVVAALASGSAS